MKPMKKTLVAITVTGVLTGTALAALADNAKGKPFEGVLVEDIVVIEQFPTEVQKGSIRVDNDNEHALVQKVKIDSGDAAAIAVKALPGSVVETRLDDENGYLIWDVEVVGTNGRAVQLKIDAGNGYLLAMEAGEDGEHEGMEGGEDGEHRDGDREDRGEGKHSSWKFWEDNDRDDQHEDRD